jgi:hypothetical protein
MNDRMLLLRRAPCRNSIPALRQATAQAQRFLLAKPPHAEGLCSGGVGAEVIPPIERRPAPAEPCTPRPRTISGRTAVGLYPIITKTSGALSYASIYPPRLW